MMPDFAKMYIRRDDWFSTHDLSFDTQGQS